MHSTRSPLQKCLVACYRHRNMKISVIYKITKRVSFIDNLIEMRSVRSSGVNHQRSSVHIKKGKKLFDLRQIMALLQELEKEKK